MVSQRKMICTSVLILSLLVCSEGRTVPIFMRILRKDTQKCSVYENEPMLAVFDRVCSMCHEMYRHESPNLRSSCRSNCFENDDFLMCLELFSPGGVPQISRRSGGYYFRK